MSCCIEIVLKNQTGLHARPASLFVKEASKYASQVKVIKDQKEYNAKSMMGILSMGAATGDHLMIVAEGEDEEKAIEGLKELVSRNFGE
ncbi:MAG: HPr family phosphocarrier protein [Bacillota bacterium]